MQNKFEIQDELIDFIDSLDYYVADHYSGEIPIFKFYREEPINKIISNNVKLNTLLDHFIYYSNSVNHLRKLIAFLNYLKEYYPQYYQKNIDNIAAKIDLKKFDVNNLLNFFAFTGKGLNELIPTLKSIEAKKLVIYCYYNKINFNDEQKKSFEKEMKIKFEKCIERIESGLRYRQFYDSCGGLGSYLRSELIKELKINVIPGEFKFWDKYEFDTNSQKMIKYRLQCKWSDVTLEYYLKLFICKITPFAHDSRPDYLIAYLNFLKDNYPDYYNEIIDKVAEVVNIPKGWYTFSLMTFFVNTRKGLNTLIEKIYEQVYREYYVPSNIEELILSLKAYCIKNNIKFNEYRELVLQKTWTLILLRQYNLEDKVQEYLNRKDITLNKEEINEDTIENKEEIKEEKVKEIKKLSRIFKRRMK